MSWDQAVALRLLNDADVASLLAAHPVDGIKSVSWDVLRENAPRPAIVLKLVSDPRPQNCDGFDVFRESRVQVNCQAWRKSDSVALREAAIAALVTGGEQYGTTFLQSFVDQLRTGGGDTEAGFVFEEQIDFLLWHN